MRVKSLKVDKAATAADVPRWASYPDDPVGYFRDVLRVDFLWDRMVEVLEAVRQPPHKILVGSGHKIGKTFLLAGLINWHFDSYDPGWTILTSPTYEAMCDTVWREVRTQRIRAGLPLCFRGDSSPEMRTGPNHVAKGLSTNKPEAFQGKHLERMLFVIDEAVGVESSVWTVISSMFKPEAKHAWICTFNPTDTSSQAYREDRSGSWRKFRLSSLDHPNIAAGLAGEPLPVPAAVSVGQVDEWIAKWCSPVTGEPEVTDIQWRGQWYRPGPEMEARALGLWPSQAFGSVWSDALWRAITEADDPAAMVRILPDDVPQLGCDVARFGDDATVFHVRWGNTSVHHESASGWRITQTAGRLIELAEKWAEACNVIRRARKAAEVDAKEIPIKVDDDGVGGGVTDILMDAEYRVVPVRAGSHAYDGSRYPNKRSELWFRTRDLAGARGVWLGRLPRATQESLRIQAMAPLWALDGAGRRTVEKKEATKKRLGRSPDDMDGVNLAYYEDVFAEAPEVLEEPKREPTKNLRSGSRAAKRGLFGR